MVVLTNHYDASGRVDWQRDAGQQTSYSYGAPVTQGQQTVVTNTVSYPAAGFDGTTPTVADTYTSDVSDPASARLTQRVSRPSASESYTATYGYDANRNLSQVTDPRGNTALYCYDTDYAGAAVTTSHGNLTRRIAPAPAGGVRPVTLFKYDNKNNLLEAVVPRGVSSSGSTTCADNLATSINALYVTTNSYNAQGALLSATRKFTDPDLGQRTATTKYEYGDAANPGRITRIIPPRGNTGDTPDYTYATTLAYYGSGSQASLLQSQTDALNHTTTYTYDAVGRLTGMIDPNGQLWELVLPRFDGRILLGRSGG